MNFLTRLFGRGRGNRIRKQSGDLGPADFEFSKVWEFCPDEETFEGQDECTVRPRPDITSVNPETFDGAVACRVSPGSGRKMQGLVWPTWNDRSDSIKFEQSEIWLPGDAQSLCDEPLPTSLYRMIYDKTTRIAFALTHAEYQSDAEVRSGARLIYKVLRESEATLWPITFTPLVPIQNAPASWQLKGWYRPDGTIMR